MKNLQELNEIYSQDLINNLFQHPSLKEEFGFYKEKNDGYRAIFRAELPYKILDNFKTI
jgi:hypothetical protein